MNVGEQRPVRINCLYSFLETEDFHHMTGVSNEKEINVLWCIRKCPSIFCVCHPTCYWFYKKLYSNQLEQKKKSLNLLQQGSSLLEHAQHLGSRETCVIRVKLIKTYIK